MKVTGWQDRLARYVDAARAAPPTHCAYFAGRAVDVIRHNDTSVVPEDMTGQKKRDLVRLRAMGYDDHVDFIASVLDATDTPVPGDVVVIQSEPGAERIVGVLQGRMVYVMSEWGLMMFPRSMVTGAFSV